MQSRGSRRLAAGTERGEYPDGELRRTAPLGELDQRVEVEARVDGDAGGEEEGEAAADELVAPPGDDVAALLALSQSASMINWCPAGDRSYPNRAGNCATRPSESMSAIFRISACTLS